MNELNETALLYNSLVVGTLLFVLGLIGVVVRRNVIVMFLCVEMMLQGVAINLISWGRHYDDWGGQVLVLFIIAVAAAEAGIALALILMLFHQAGTLDVGFWQQIHEDNVAPFVDEEIPEAAVHSRVWPSLTPAGVTPQVDPEEQLHRSRV
jgi:NADH-quinone oxidoreductase subunit K